MGYVSGGLKLNAMGKNNRMGNSARGMAPRIILVFLSGTLVGSLAPETGNILAYMLKMPYKEGHFFNPYFLGLGIIGIVLACAFRYRQRS